MSGVRAQPAVTRCCSGCRLGGAAWGGRWPTRAGGCGVCVCVCGVVCCAVLWQVWPAAHHPFLTSCPPGPRRIMVFYWWLTYNILVRRQARCVGVKGGQHRRQAGRQAVLGPCASRGHQAQRDPACTAQLRCCAAVDAGTSRCCRPPTRRAEAEAAAATPRAQPGCSGAASCFRYARKHCGCGPSSPHVPLCAAHYGDGCRLLLLGGGLVTEIRHQMRGVYKTAGGEACCC